MRKVIGIGETILDILFLGDDPVAAVPGGSSFNGIVSLARAGVPTCFVSETGEDEVGRKILRFMEREGIGTEYVGRFSDGKSPVSLAFLDEDNEASYLFYKNYPALRLQLPRLPEIQAGDLVLYGAYYSLNPVLRPKVLSFLEYARRAGAILYYDPNFRASHAAEVPALLPAIEENMRLADVVRGSILDFEHIYGPGSPAIIYKKKVKELCPCFICTEGAGGVTLQAPGVGLRHYAAHELQPVSTIGAGDSFNAGILYGILELGLDGAALPGADAGVWDRLIGRAQDFSADVCRSHENYISPSFAANLRKGHC